MGKINSRLPRNLDRQYRRALGLRNITISEALHAHARQFIKQTREMFPEAFEQEQPLTPYEEAVLEAVEEGHYEPKHIAEYTELALKRIERVLQELAARGLLEAREQGGKTEVARGARRTIWVLANNRKVK